MRRPVKPFVTEYKGNTRRPPSPSIKLEEDAPPGRPPEPYRFVSVSQSEDSYEAALRAADALFSGPGRRDSSEDLAAEDGEDGPHAGSPAPVPGGRILRVIDEAPAQDVLDLEVERAPKRRGRKPGSKNKPRIVESRAEGMRIPPPEVAAPWSETLPPLVALIAPPAPVTPANLNVAKAGDPEPRPIAVTTGQRRGPRYAWVRTQLKPGQSWKRHLPKVIW